MNKMFGLVLTLGAVVLVGCTAKANEIIGKNLSEVPYEKTAVTLDTNVAGHHVVGYAVMSTQTSSIGGFGAIAALKQPCMIDFFANDQGVIGAYRIRARKSGDCEGLGKKAQHKALKQFYGKDVALLKEKWGEPAETYALPVEEDVKCSESSLMGDCPKYIFNVKEQQVLVYHQDGCNVQFMLNEKNAVDDYIWDGQCDKLHK